MKAIVQERYGSPEDLELREVDTPVVGDDEVLVRVRAASLHPDVWHVVSGRPVRPPPDGSRARQTQEPDPRHGHGGDRRVRRQERDAVSPGRPGLRRDDRRPAVGQRRRLRRVRVRPPGPAGAQAGQRHVRAGRLRPDLRVHRPAEPPRPESAAAGAEGADQRRRGRGRCARPADREGLRRARDRRGRHGQAGHAPLARGRRGRRLHAGGLHPTRRSLRSHLRRPGELPGLRLQARAQARREIRAHRARALSEHRASACSDSSPTSSRSWSSHAS